MLPAFTRTDCPAAGVTVVYVFAEFATGIDRAAMLVSPVPPLETATVPVTLVAVPVMVIPQVPEAFVPVSVGA